MEIFERIDIISKKLAGSRIKLAKVLEIQPTTFNGYFAMDRQNNFWGILPKILEVYPIISREWLYFGEGEMLNSDKNKEHRLIESQKEIEFLQRINNLNQRLCVKDDKIASLEKEVAELKE